MTTKTTKKRKLYDAAQWYIITVVSGNEDLVIKNLKGKIEAYGLSDLVQDIKLIKDVITTEETFTDATLPANYGRKIKNVKWEHFTDENGKEKFKKIKTEEVNRYYGYIFIKMEMTDESWYAIRNTQLITGIVGSSGKNAKPIPVGDDEIGKILSAVDMGVKSLDGKTITTSGDAIILQKEAQPQVVKSDFKVGQTVRIIAGQFSGERATITSVNDEKQKIIVSVDFFGRDTDAEIDFSECELDI